MNCEIERDAPFTIGELICTAILFVAFVAGIVAIALCFGCKTYYENAGMRVRAGEITAPIEVSEPTSSTNIRFLFFLNGLDVYARKDCNVRIKYTSVKGESLFTSATTQAVEVVVMPWPTNTVESVAK